MSAIVYHLDKSDQLWQFLNNEEYCFYGAAPGFKEAPALSEDNRGALLCGQLGKSLRLADPILGKFTHSYSGRRTTFNESLWLPHFIGIQSSGGKTVITYLRFDNSIARGSNLEINRSIIKRNIHDRSFSLNKAAGTFCIRPIVFPFPLSRLQLALKPSSDMLERLTAEASGLADRAAVKIKL